MRLAAGRVLRADHARESPDFQHNPRLCHQHHGLAFWGASFRPEAAPPAPLKRAASRWTLARARFSWVRPPGLAQDSVVVALVHRIRGGVSDERDWGREPVGETDPGETSDNSFVPLSRLSPSSFWRAGLLEGSLSLVSLVCLGGRAGRRKSQCLACLPRLCGGSGLIEGSLSQCLACLASCLGVGEQGGLDWHVHGFFSSVMLFFAL